MSVTREQITKVIRSLGVGPGNLLVVHTSLKSFGHVEGGADAAAMGIVDAIQPAGSVFMPTFNFGQLPFDPLTTRSLTGAITESFRKMPGVVRSSHPTHPVAGSGPNAAAILEGHENRNPFGPDSPLWRLWQRNAWVLLIGCGHESNSAIHVAEEALKLPYIERTRVGQILGNGEVINVTVRRPGCSDAFNKIEPLLRQRGFLIEGQVGSARLRLMRSGDLVETAMDMLQHDPTSLFCDNPACDACPEARRMLAKI